MRIKESSPLKYHLDLHLHESFTDEGSILFEITRYCLSQTQDLSNLKFTSKTLKYIFGDQMKDENFKDKIIQSVKSGIKNSIIIVKGKSMIVSESFASNYF
jgi:hypothetical protein